MSKIHSAQNGHTVVTIFDRAYPADTQAEGQAVSWAVAGRLLRQRWHHLEASGYSGLHGSQSGAAGQSPEREGKVVKWQSVRTSARRDG